MSVASAQHAIHVIPDSTSVLSVTLILSSMSVASAHRAIHVIHDSTSVLSITLTLSLMSVMSAQHAIHVIHDSTSVLSVMQIYSQSCQSCQPPPPPSNWNHSKVSVLQFKTEGQRGDMYYSRWKRHKHQREGGWETNTLFIYLLYTGGKNWRKLY
jgi:hypothetical protein